MLKLYAEKLKGGWEELEIPNDLEAAKEVADSLSSKEYFVCIIKERKNGQDNIVYRREIYKECEVEYTDDVKVDFEVKAITFKPSKMKEKQKLKKEIDKYL